MIKFEIAKGYEGLKESILDIQTIFKDSDNTIHKARNEIKIVDNLIIKSFKKPHFINKIIYTFFKKSKAKKSYKNSQKINSFTPDAIGYIEFKKFGLLDSSYFVSKKFDYDFTIREPLLDKNFADREKIFKEFANFTYNLHAQDILHLDYSPGNILIKKTEDEYIFKIVDINRMKFKRLTMKERCKNFSKLWAKDDDLTIIAKEYIKLIAKDEKKYLKKILYYSQKHKDIKNFKKRLKGKKVVD